MRSGPLGLSGVGAVQAVASKSVSVNEIRSDALDRISAWEPELGAVTDVLDRPARLESRLTGLMVGVKDQIDVARYPHPVARLESPDPSTARHDAPVVERLLAAGATLVARTASSPPGSPGAVTPQTLNPRRKDRLSGGSSGGSAAAVAAGMVHVALGTDSGGSIRIPASACGVVGLNPTRGLVPMAGTGGLTYSLGSVGPIASSVADVRLVLDVIADRAVAGTCNLGDGRVDMTALQVGIPDAMLAWNSDAEVRVAFDDVLGRLRDAGANLQRVVVPGVEDAIDLGPRTVGVVEVFARLQDDFPRALHAPEFSSLVEQAGDVSAPSLARAYDRIAEFAVGVDRVFDTCDVLILPTLPCRVPGASDSHVEADIEVGGVVEHRTSALTRLVNPWNLAGVPSGTVPIGRDAGDGPLGIQIVGRRFSDWEVLNVMESIQELVGGPWDTVGPLD